MLTVEVKSEDDFLGFAVKDARCDRGEIAGGGDLRPEWRRRGFSDKGEAISLRVHGSFLLRGNEKGPGQSPEGSGPVLVLLSVC